MRSILMIFAMATPALSQQPALDDLHASVRIAESYSVCLTIEPEDERLACYDGLAGEITAIIGSARENAEQEASGTNVDVGAWQVRQQTSEFDDTPTVYLSLEAEEDVVGRFGRSVRFELIARCLENTTTFYIHFGDFFMSDNQGRGRIEYRVDDREAGSVRMRESTDHNALGLWRGRDSIPFLREIMDGSRMVIRATPYSESTLTARFNIAGLDAALVPLREACGW